MKNIDKLKDQGIKYRVNEIAQVAESVKKVSLSDEAIGNRNYKLEKASSYGTRFKIEALLVVATTTGDVKIKSIIFEVNEKNVKLKGRILIPTASIKEVDFVL